MQVAVAAAPPFMKNGYVVSCDDTREAVLIDPGDEVDALIGHVRESDVTVRHILLTHAHVDHVTGVGRAKAAFGVPVWMHPDDQFLYDNVVEHARLFGLRAERQPPVDHYFAPPQQLAFGRLVVDVRHTPGHCPGGVCLAIGPADGEARELFVGDTLFAGAVGRTDLPGGDHARLIRSIREALLVYPDATVVHAGHGPDTTIGDERRTNPFLT